MLIRIIIGHSRFLLLSDLAGASHKDHLIGNCVENYEPPTQRFYHQSLLPYPFGVNHTDYIFVTITRAMQYVKNTIICLHDNVHITVFICI